MCRPQPNDRGISLVEVVIAMFLTTVGVLAILSMQPSAWRVVGKSDYMGRAAGILQEELERQEAFIMNPLNSVTLGTTTTTVFTGGQGAAVTGAGDAAYTVTTSITGPGTGIWQVTVTVTWANQLTRNYRNVQDSILVSRQDAYSY